MKIDFKISNNYEITLDKLHKKNKGIYYTPKFIVDYILSKTVKKHDIIKNPCPKIADISCGCGNFLLEAYDLLYEMIEKNLESIKQQHSYEYWNNVSIHKHIVENCIYGYDIDEDAINILKLRLQYRSDEVCNVDKNIKICDSLKYEFNNKFDYIVGNPPYVGHKQLQEDYREFLLENYRDVYTGKSDIYFCFYKKALNLAKKNALISLITPRYFIESPSAKSLREYLNEFQIKEIVDFAGSKIFKDLGVCNCILTIKNNKQIIDTKVYRFDDNENIKFIGIDKSTECTISRENFEWIITNKQDENLYRKINKKQGCSLEEIVTNFQGIITGCDKAFIIDNTNIYTSLIHKSILKPWIKNQNISSYKINQAKYKIIYSNDIKDPKQHKSAIKYIGNYKNKLENRRECKRGIRKWYELQWGRDKSNFEQTKIVYPYKACSNKFAIDYYENFFSADVYSFYIKDDYKEIYSYEYLVGVLNSKIYDRYFKIIAKKISKNMYDYYPNKVLQMKIFKDENYEEIENISKEILRKIEINEDISPLQKEIDKLIECSLELK